MRYDDRHRRHPSHEQRRDARAARRREDLPGRGPAGTDDAGHPLGWLSDRDVERERVQAPADATAALLIDRDTVLRDALAELLSAGTQYGPVVDAAGVVVGVLSITIFSDLLAERDTREIDPVERIAP